MSNKEYSQGEGYYLFYYFTTIHNEIINKWKSSENTLQGQKEMRILGTIPYIIKYTQTRVCTVHNFVYLSSFQLLF